ncbi:thyroid adenoma-associated protein homolog [Chelonus insularis]|uniref:thyroid adenoma-associated protein homolog n=1 Tax=Chelonus insularis TaxID=460826 RepID=UPI00158B8FD8|nr:thyroid adenoma-associated protein homolog [Chelonus insularis]
MSKNDILKTLHELLKQKLSGELDSTDDLLNDQVKWRQQLYYKQLTEYLTNSCEQIKLSTLSLLVESKKSTLSFSEKELNLILTFLKFNLGKKFEFIPLLKKALQRLNNNTAVLERNTLQLEKFESSIKGVEIDEHQELYAQRKKEYEKLANDSFNLLKIYKSFFIDIRKLCLNSIFIGATHIRKENSLLLLQLQQEIWHFKDDNEINEWTADQANQLFQCLLLDTYETNKNIAFKIISKLKPSILQLDDEKQLETILNVAFKLANSMRPIDSITAAYMLKVCMMSPIIEEIIEMRWNVKSKGDITLQLIMVLLQYLKKPVELNYDNIIQVVSKYSLYGYIFCIKTLISSCDFKKVHTNDCQNIITDIIDTCLYLNKAVSSVVNNSSPEGHFPMDMNKKYLNITEDLSEINKVTPQMVLICSWRTVKETSLLFGHLMIKLPIINNDLDKGLLTNEHILKIGDHLVTLLCETKHRGAFEQAHVGFEQLCSRLWKLKDEKFNKLPKIWLYQLLIAITGLAPGNSKLCATRRSAGVPFMVQALVTSDPSLKNREGIAFHSIMRILLSLTKIENENELLTIADKLINQESFFSDLKDYEEINTYKYSSVINSGDGNNRVTIIDLKTHVLNILRALFKHAQLRDLAGIYAADGLIIAVKNYDSQTWAERNSATLLFSALITRIFGVQRTKDYVNLTVHNKMTGQIFFEKYPQLLSFMLDELKLFIHNENNAIKPSIQSILLILSRLYLNTNSDRSNANWKVDTFVKFVSACAKSVVYTTRELAARAIVPLLTEKTVCSFINDLFNDIEMESKKSILRQWNLIHGYLLQILQIVQSSLFVTCNLKEIKLIKFLTNSTWIIKKRCWSASNSLCYPLAAAYINVVHEFMRIYEQRSKEIDYIPFNEILSESIIYLIDDNPKQSVGKELFECSIVQFFIDWQRITDSKDVCELEKWLKIWTKILSHSNTHVQILGWFNIHEIIYKKYYKRYNNSSLLNSNIQDALLSVAIDQAFNKIKQDIFDIDLQTAIQEFLYQVYTENEPNDFCTNQIQFDNDICMTIVVFIEKSNHIRAPNTLKLLGKIFKRILKYPDSTECDKRLFIDRLSILINETFFYNSWTSTSTLDYRLAIAHVIGDIYIDISINNWRPSRECLLDWWTTLLNLLVDDNAEVREMGLLALSNLKVLKNDESYIEPLEMFFETFFNTFDNESDTLFAAYFFWSTSLSDNDFEMDESDVFNKCFNYEMYEPFQICELCNCYLNKLSKNTWNFPYNFSDDVQKWLSKRLDIPISNCVNVHTLISIYKTKLPSVTNNLNEILDPMYNDKLLNHLAFEKITTFVDANYDQQ